MTAFVSTSSAAAHFFERLEGARAIDVAEYTNLLGEHGWYAAHGLDDFPLGPFASRDDAEFAAAYADGLLAVLAIDSDARRR